MCLAHLTKVSRGRKTEVGNLSKLLGCSEQRRTLNVSHMIVQAPNSQAAALHPPPSLPSLQTGIGIDRQKRSIQRSNEYKRLIVRRRTLAVNHLFDLLGSASRSEKRQSVVQAVEAQKMQLQNSPSRLRLTSMRCER